MVDTGVRNPTSHECTQKLGWIQKNRLPHTIPYMKALFMGFPTLYLISSLLKKNFHDICLISFWFSLLWVMLWMDEKLILAVWIIFFCSCVTYLLTTTNKTKNYTTFCGTKNINNFCHTSRTAEIFWFAVVFTLKLTSHCCRHQIWRLQYFYFIKKPPKNGTFFPIAKILLFGQKSGAHHFL